MDPGTNQRPIILEGGNAVVAPVGGVTVTWDGNKPGVSPRLPREVAPWEPAAWPERGLPEATGLLELLLSDQPLGYLGPKERALERRFEARMGEDSRVFACANGTVALEIAYTALLTQWYRLERRPMVGKPSMLCSVISFQATWTQLLKCGLRPRFVDVSPDTGCIDVEQLERHLRPDVIGVTVTLTYDGCPDMRALRRFCDRHDLLLIADAAHAPFARWEGKPLTSWADVVTLSEQGSKVLTPGSESGAVATRDRVVAALMRMIINCGRRPKELPAWWPGPEELPDDFHVSGDNFRSDEYRAVVLHAQLDRYEKQLPHRMEQLHHFRHGLRRLTSEVPGLPFSLPPQQPQVSEVFYKTALHYQQEVWGIPRNAMAHWLARELTVEVAKCYAMPWDPASGFLPESRPWVWAGLVPALDPADFPNAVRYADTALLLPHEFWLRRDASEQLLAALRKMVRWHDHPEVRAWATGFKG